MLVQVAEIMSFNQGLSALSLTVVGAEARGIAEQLPARSALAARVRAEQARMQAMAQEIEHLRRALASRDIIGQAKGMLMERFDVDAAAAFDLLVRLSQTSNIPVAVIAQKLVDVDHPGT